MRDLVTAFCFVCLLTGLGMAETFYFKWKTYVACSQINLLVAQGRFERTLELVKSRSDILRVDTIDEAVDLCRVEES
jgi:hypothetical protein